MTDKNELVLNDTSLLCLPEENDENYTLIEINSKIYAIKTTQVLEIIKIMELDYPNRLPTCILGIIKYEQTPVGVIDLRSVFSDERIVYGLSAKIIVLKTDENISSIICDKVLDIKKLKKDNIKELPFKKETDFFEGVYMCEDKSIYILNVENITNYINKNPDKFQNDENKRYIADDEHSKEILSKRKNFLIKVIAEVQTNKALYDRGVSFIINDVKYYINMASVREFYKVNNSKFIKIPNTPSFIFGVTNIKGDYVTVLDIRKFFNNSKTTIKEKSTIIILNSDEFKLGILADEICESMNIDFDEIIQNRLQTQEETKMMEFVKDGEIYQVIDVEQLFKDERLAVV